MYGAYAIAFWYGCELLSRNELTPGDVFTVSWQLVGYESASEWIFVFGFAVSFQVFFSVLVGAFALGNAVPFISTVAIAQGSGSIVFEVIDSKPDIDPYSKEGFIPDNIEGRIKFKNVTFKYPERPQIQVRLHSTSSYFCGPS